MGGVPGGVAMTLMFPIGVFLDGQEHSCRLQADFIGQERILGRDVLNHLDALFRGPTPEPPTPPSRSGSGPGRAAPCAWVCHL